MTRYLKSVFCFLAFLYFASINFSNKASAQTASASNAENIVRFPGRVRVNGGKFHVQGLACDSQAACMYFSFTSAFFKTDMEGNIVASIADINGHIGAMTFDGKNRKVIASLEIKDDEIGRNIAQKLGQEAWTREQAGFYLAVIDIDKLTRKGMKQEEVMALVRLEEVCNDYRAKVNVNGESLEHRFACSGIDGVTIGPGFVNGAESSEQERYVYVAYGIYGDTTRTDNDYNVILAYKLDDILSQARNDSSSCTGSQSCETSSCRNGSRQLTPVHKYFVHTGNTQWGVQNLAYDSSSNKMFMAVYKGHKRQWPNYSLFALDMNQLASSACLEGVPYCTSLVEQLEVSGAWHFKWGSTGLCPLGDSLFYISHNGASDGNNYCEAHLYRWQGSSSPDVSPFVLTGSVKF